MHYSKINPVDIANGPGCRVSLFVSGCTRHCPGCFNSEAWPFDAGEPYTKEVEDHILQLLEQPHIKGLSILGGEPLEDANWQTVGKLCETVKERFSEKTIWLYTGGSWEDALNYPLIHFIDVLVDGAFIEAERDISLRFRGSKNQRIIDVQQSLKSDTVVLWDDWQSTAESLANRVRHD